MWIPQGGIATLMAVIGLLGWGLWGNMLILSGRAGIAVRFEVFYTDFIFALFIMSCIFGLIFGEIVVDGDTRTFTGTDFDFSGTPGLAQSVGWVFGGGVVWNIGNIFLCKGIEMLGLALAFPLGVGTAMWLGTAATYGVSPDYTDPGMLFGGVAVGFVAVCVCALCHHLKNQAAEADAKLAGDSAASSDEAALESGKQQPVTATESEASNAKAMVVEEEGPSEVERKKADPGFLRSLLVVIFAGICLGLGGLLPVYGFQETRPENFVPGRLSPYGSMFWYTFACVCSNLLIVPLHLLFPLDGAERVSFSTYFHDYFKTPIVGHLICLGAGAIWTVGFLGVYTSSQSPALSPSVAYALGQCAPFAGILSGLIFWGEFNGQKWRVWAALAGTVALYVVAIVLMTLAHQPE